MNPLEDDGPLSRRGFLVASAGAAAAAGASATATAQEDDNESDDGGNDTATGDDGSGNETVDEDGESGNESNGNESDGGTGDGGGGSTETVSVVDTAFEPADITILPGTTVEWVWEGEMEHNVIPTGQPEESDWEGHGLQTSGEYSHTFDVEGDYEYTCDPHPGMDGTITVDPNADQMGGGPIDLVPDAAMTLVIATVAGMVSTLSLVYFFMRYGGTAPE